MMRARAGTVCGGLRRAVTLASVLVAVAIGGRGGLAGQSAPGVFLRLASYAPGSYESVLSNVRAAATGAGWTILADYETGVNRKRCAYHGRVLVAHWPEYATSVVKDGAQGAFAAPTRLEVYEDETGVHVAAVNPRSLNRTIVSEQGRDAEWTRFSERLASALHARLPGTTTEYGQRRENGRIGKTMGVMAGGPFNEKVKTLASVPAGVDGVRGVARRLYAGLEKQAATGDWRLRPVFLQEVAAGVVVLGVTGEPMEAKSYDIVGSGGNRQRAAMTCPGIDHAAAYPLELVLVQEGALVHIRSVDEMFRMKMYFEDAGMMAFARNMGMPGSIGDELRRKIAAALSPAS